MLFICRNRGYNGFDNCANAVNLFLTVHFTDKIQGTYDNNHK